MILVESFSVIEPIGFPGFDLDGILQETLTQIAVQISYLVPRVDSISLQENIQTALEGT